MKKYIAIVLAAALAFAAAPAGPADAENCSYNAAIANGCIVMQDGVPVGQAVEFITTIDGDAAACWSIAGITYCVAAAMPVIAFAG
jgi:hypothetical protein